MHKTSKICEPRSWPPSEASLNVKASLLFNAHGSVHCLLLLLDLWDVLVFLNFCKIIVSISFVGFVLGSFFML